MVNSVIKRIQPDFAKLIREINIISLQNGGKILSATEITKRITNKIKENRLLYNEIIKIK